MDYFHRKYNNDLRKKEVNFNVLLEEIYGENYKLYEFSEEDKNKLKEIFLLSREILNKYEKKRKAVEDIKNSIKIFNLFFWIKTLSI